MQKKIIAIFMVFALACIILYSTGSVQAGEKVKLSQEKMTLKVGEQKKLKLNGTKKKVKWSSNKKEVATVSQKGVVKAKKKGRAVITASVGKKKYKCEVTVKKKTSNNKPVTTPSPSHASATGSTVYMTTDISSDAMMKIYAALGRELAGDKIAVKVSTGEPPSSNYLRPELIKELVQHVNGTIVECNTAYGGSRSETAMHYQVAKDHGFADIADFVVMDEDGSMTIPVEGGIHLKENYVGAHFKEYDGFLVLSHFKGHAMAGFGGAIKNISIGIGSAEGKCLIHTGGQSHTSPWGGDQDGFLESMAEAGKSVVDYLKGNILYVNVMNRLSIDCDCDGNPAEPDIHDIGILASTDPVALDQACVDLIYQAEGNQSFVNRMEGRNAQHVLEAGEKIGLGMRAYNIVNVN